MSPKMKELLKIEYLTLGKYFNYREPTTIDIRAKYWEKFPMDLELEWENMVDAKLILVNYQSKIIEFPDELIDEIFKE